MIRLSKTPLHRTCGVVGEEGVDTRPLVDDEVAGFEAAPEVGWHLVPNHVQASTLKR